MYCLVDKQNNICSILNTETFTVDKLVDSVCEKLVKDLGFVIEGVSQGNRGFKYRISDGVLPSELDTLHSAYKHIVLGLQKRGTYLGNAIVHPNLVNNLSFNIYDFLCSPYCYLLLSMHSMINGKLVLSSLGSTRGVSNQLHEKISSSCISIDCLSLSGTLPVNLAEFLYKFDSGIVLHNSARVIEGILLILR